MSDNSQNNPGQSGIDPETERRNRENETGEQSQQPPQAGQNQPPEAGQQSDTLTQSQSEQSEGGQSEGETGFVGSGGDQSSDYLTKGENQDFQPEGQGATDSDAGDADITTGQPTSSDSTLDDGADTSH